MGCPEPERRWHERLFSPRRGPAPEPLEPDAAAREAVRREAAGLIEELRRDVAALREAGDDDRLGYPLASALRRRKEL